MFQITFVRGLIVKVVLNTPIGKCVCVGGGGVSVCVVYRAYRNGGFMSRRWKLGVEAT